MNLEDSRIKIGTAVALTVAALSYGWGFVSWANEQHEKAEARSVENKQLIEELKRGNALLVQIQAQQAELVKEAAKDAKQNRESLIRIETKLETRPE